ncbi:hemerythrin domain-containing protein [Geodermatophilus sp. URMC 64]
MTAAQTIDTREMVVVHTAFRREFTEAPALIRSVAAGDRERVRRVGDHVQLMLEMLHHHHDGEDRLLWPKLLDRVEVDLRPVIELMERQHQGIHAELGRATESLARWRDTAGADEREQLAGCVERLTALLEEHLAAEEERLLPLAARCLTQQEWDQLGEEGMGGIPKKQLPTVFGMIMKDGDPEVIRTMLSHAPPPVRVLLPRVAPRLYARYARRLRAS